MKCTICSIENKELLQEIEYHLEANEGVLPERTKLDLIEKYPAMKKQIEDINDQDCSMHWNFHQSVARPASLIKREPQDVNGEKNGSSLTEDIAKDEAEVLYELLNEQAATFRCLSRKINKAVEKMDGEEANQMLIHPNTSILYKETADSIRLTVKSIMEMNASINGSKNDALTGLKALANALTGAKAESSIDEEKKDLTTQEYDY